jgi:aldose 1-epimerase
LYEITEREEEGLHYLELRSPDGKSKAQICLQQGARLSGFVYDEEQILADFHPTTYKDNYAASILFPYANRIRNGKYTYDGTVYQLDCNEVDKQNAIHGLVYNRTFSCVNKKRTADNAVVNLKYSDDGTSKGFPFKFSIELTYSLSNRGLSLSVKVFNIGEQAFPFAIGWHPYFASSDINQTIVNFESDEKYCFDAQQIISGTQKLDIEMPWHLRGERLDDCYLLKTNEVDFITPKYTMKISSTSKENFLQLYTPERLHTIAIEPMTGVANNFNNKIGLLTLNPHETYHIVWDLVIENHTNTVNRTNQ